MKKVMLFVIIMGLVSVVLSQETKKSSLVSFGGSGVIFSTNSSTSFVGFVGPKISATIKVAEKTRIELGINAIPGLLVKPETKPGLALGGFMALKNNWKIKPIMAVTFVKTKEWQPMLGVGFTF